LTEFFFAGEKDYRQNKNQSGKIKLHGVSMLIFKSKMNQGNPGRRIYSHERKLHCAFIAGTAFCLKLSVMKRLIQMLTILYLAIVAQAEQQISRSFPGSGKRC